MAVYCVILEGRPGRNRDEYGVFQGAFITCWAKAESPEQALADARRILGEDGWTILSEEDVFTADLADYRDRPKSRQCYERALNRGFSALCYYYHEDGPRDLTEENGEDRPVDESGRGSDPV